MIVGDVPLDITIVGSTIVGFPSGVSPLGDKYLRSPPRCVRGDETLVVWCSLVKPLLMRYKLMLVHDMGNGALALHLKWEVLVSTQGRQL